MEDNDIPDLMRVRLRRYFHHIRNLQIMNAAAEVVGKLSSTLQVEVVMHVHSTWIAQVSFLKSQVEQGCIVQVARAMQAIVFSPNELPPARTLYVIKSGIILRKRLMASGSTFGEDVCVSGPPDEHCTPTRCMTYAEMLALTQARLFRIVANFDKGKKAVRRVEVVYLIYRGILRVVKQAARIAGKQRKGGSSKDFVHALIDASTDEARNAMVDAGGFIVKSAEEDVMDATDKRFLAIEKEVAGLRHEMRGTNEMIRELIDEMKKPSGLPLASSSGGKAKRVEVSASVRAASSLDETLDEIAADEIAAAAGVGRKKLKQRSQSVGALMSRDEGELIRL